MSLEAAIDRWMAECREEGLREGRQEGVREGQLEGWVQGQREGEAHLLIKQLTLRFGELAVTILSRVHSASSEQLESWACRLLLAERLADVFGD